MNKVPVPFYNIGRIMKVDNGVIIFSVYSPSDWLLLASSFSNEKNDPIEIMIDDKVSLGKFKTCRFLSSEKIKEYNLKILVNMPMEVFFILEGMI